VRFPVVESADRLSHQLKILFKRMYIEKQLMCKISIIPKMQETISIVVLYKILRSTMPGCYLQSFSIDIAKIWC